MSERIRIGKAEIEVSAGEKPKHVSLTELEEEKNKGSKKGAEGKGQQQYK